MLEFNILHGCSLQNKNLKGLKRTVEDNFTANFFLIFSEKISWALENA